MRTIRYEAHDETATEKLGSSLVVLLPPTALIALCGTLGAGKTRLVKAMGEATGVPADAVLSPTFTLCNEYSGARPIYHFDLYRIADEDELQELGLDEYLQKPGLTIIEWADRFPQALPADKLTIVIEIIDEHSRRFELTADTAAYEEMLLQLEKRLQ